MKLHLPKLLLTAVLAACVMANTASAEWSTSETDTFYMDSTTVEEVSTVGRTPGNNGFFVRTHNNENYVNSSITTLKLGDTHRVNLDGSWDDVTKEFNVLTIDKVVAVGTGTINVALNNSVSVGEVEGTLNVQTAGNTTFNKAATLNDVTISNGSVTFAGSEGTEYSLQNIYAENGTVNVTGGSLVLNNGLTTAGSGSLSISEGASLTTSATIYQNGSGSVTLNGTIVIDTTDLTKFEIAAAGDDATYSDGSDGFMTTSGATYYLVKGEATGSATSSGEYVLSYGENGVTFVDSSFITTEEYLVNTAAAQSTDGTFKYKLNGVDAVLNVNGTLSNSRIIMGEGKVAVSAGNTLNIDTAGDNASALLTSTQGDGNIQLSTGGVVVMANGTATQATGKLIVSAGTTFKAGEGTTHAVDTSSFTSVELAGGTVYAHNNGMTLNNLSTTEESTLHVEDMQAQNSVVRLSGTTVLNAELNVTSGFKGTLQIDKLTGTGNLDVKVGNNAYSDALKVTINGIETYSGTIRYEGDDQTNNAIAINNTSSGFSVGGFELTEGAKASVNTGGDVTLGAGIIDNSTLTLRRTGGAYSVSYSSLDVSGTSTIQTADGATNNNSWQAVVNIGTLTGADATLKLRSGSNTKDATVFRLNGGQGSDFSGIMEIAGYNTGNNGRKAVLSIGDATVAQNAEIKFNAESEHSTVYLAIGAENVTVKGLSDVAGAAVIVSADVTQSAASVASDGTQRTLTLNTQGNDYTTAATLSSGLNIAKKGGGSQTFSGTTTDFRGSVSVEGGSLAFAGTDALTVTDLTLAAGTKVSVGTGVAVAAEGAAPALAVTGAATLAGGSEVKGGLDLSSATSVTLNGMGSAVTITGDLTLPGRAISLSGDVLTALTGLTAGVKLGLFGVTGVFTLGDAAIESLTAENKTLLNTVFTATEITGDYYLGYEDGMVYAGKFDAVVPPTPVDPTVPEPTTATLSLLALAALAARRRRR